ncbi:transglutaminase domain-containing protein [Methanobrevibacter sp.]
MNKQILLALSVLFIIAFSATAISASDVNVTDSYATNLVDDAQDVSVPMENTADSSQSSVSSDSNVDNDSSKVSLSSEEVLESENSNNLSTNTNNDELLNSDNGITTVSASNSSEVTADSNVSSKIDISKTIQSKSITKYYKGSTKYTATFFDEYGNVLANTNVKITVNGKTYTSKTNSKGVASLAINLKPGSYKVVAQNPKTGYKLTTTFKVLSTITASDVSKVYTDGRKFSAKFYKSNGKVLAKKTIKFKLKGKTYKVKTDKNGVAKLSLKSLKKGTYKIISYNRDGLSKTNKIKVYNKVSSKLVTSKYAFLKSDSKTIKVKLLNSLGYAPSKGKVVKIAINGKTYSKKTNSNGVASLKLPSLKAGVYTVKYKFAGNAFYKASSASNKVAIYPTKTATFKVKSTTKFTYGSSNTFKVAVTSGSVPIQSKAVTFKIDGKTYTKNTDSKGVASLAITQGIGNYTVSYSIAKDSKINAKSGSSAIVVKEKSITKHNAYWLYASDMKSVSLSGLASKGVTDIFLNFKAYETQGKSGLESWIASANKVGIDVHMWVQAFYSGDTGWVNPVKNGKENTAYFTTKLNEIKTYAGLKGISGIHLDYIRYSGSGDNAAYKNTGGTEAITSFIKQVVSTVDSVNPNIVVSAALMPETTSSEHYYGQDYDAFSKYLDVVVPMVYKGNYKEDTSWITTTTQWYVEHSKGAAVWTGLQTYVSDSDTTKLSTANLNNDIVASFNGKADGVVLFRYGISNDVDFNNLNAGSGSSKTISIKNIITGATNLKKYYESNKKMPNTVTAGGITFTLPEFLYLMSQAIYQLGNKNTKDITIKTGVSAPGSPTGDTISSQDLYKAKYLTVAKNVANYIISNNRAPNYASSDVGKIIYSEIVDSFSRILAFYGSNSNTLPNYVTINYGSSSSSTGSGTGLNEKNTVTDLTKYLKATTNCEVNNAKIQSKVAELTKGLTSDSAKAKAIFNWVRDTLAYSFYYDTKYGAAGTLSAKKGNCVDHSHLLVAMFRAAKLPARYVHGKCTFSSGSTYGHVWVQVLVDNKWTVADATSSKNSLGSIANWNTKSFTLNNIYSSLPF